MTPTIATLQAKKFDLPERTMKFASRTRAFIKRIPKSLVTFDDCKQVVRSSASVGANYLEADESVSVDDRIYRMKICRKEAKESSFWFQLLKESTPQELETERLALAKESIELVKIFHSIIRNTKPAD